MTFYVLLRQMLLQETLRSLAKCLHFPEKLCVCSQNVILSSLQENAQFLWKAQKFCEGTQRL